MDAGDFYAGPGYSRSFTDFWVHTAKCMDGGERVFKSLYKGHLDKTSTIAVRY